MSFNNLDENMPDLESLEELLEEEGYLENTSEDDEKRVLFRNALKDLLKFFDDNPREDAVIFSQVILSLYIEGLIGDHLMDKDYHLIKVIASSLLKDSVGKNMFMGSLNRLVKWGHNMYDEDNCIEDFELSNYLYDQAVSAIKDRGLPESYIKELDDIMDTKFE